MNIHTYIRENRSSIQKFLQDFISHKKNTLPADVTLLQDGLDRTLEFALRGKLLRGILALFAYQMYGGTDTHSVLPASAAIELTQSMLLIHDDIMDNDEIRRGHPAVFAQYKHAAQKNNFNNPLLYGQSMGMCLGDMNIFLAHELFATCSSQSHIIKKLITTYSQEITLTCIGQMIDVHYSHAKDEPTQQDIMAMYRYKTAHYTFVMPLKIGAILAEQPDNILHQLELLGEDLGLIFQIKDDELGLFGDESQTGKPIGNDIRENKKTLLRTLLFQKVTNDEKLYLGKTFGNNDITLKEIDEIKSLVEKYNIHTSLNEQMKTLEKRITEQLERLTINPEYKQMLQEFIAYNITRVK
jgi:geranylgeranyl diphosphate synthase, type I